ncbi:MAG TPA: hypothetical protein VFR35_07455 [Actinoplanes sp.]|nr:hypothetical protein [Actinoplanes sp.]
MTAPAVLTTGSTVTCAHQAKVVADSTTRLTVGKKPVLLAPVTGKSINACPIVDDPNTATLKCKSVLSVSAGASSKLTVGRKSVLLDVLAGVTDGTPPPAGAPLAPAVANQAKLRAAVAVK